MSDHAHRAPKPFCHPPATGIARAAPTPRGAGSGQQRRGSDVSSATGTTSTSGPPSADSRDRAGGNRGMQGADPARVTAPGAVDHPQALSWFAHWASERSEVA
jgi:hypothetical protein